jgi:hypothetical protein
VKPRIGWQMRLRLVGSFGYAEGSVAGLDRVKSWQASSHNPFSVRRRQKKC